MKNPFGFLQTNPQADAWCGELRFFFVEKKSFFLNTLLVMDNKQFFHKSKCEHFIHLKVSQKCTHRVFHENMFFQKKNKRNPPRISLGVGLKESKRFLDFVKGVCTSMHQGVSQKVFKTLFQKKNKPNSPRISLGVGLKESKRIFHFDKVQGVLGSLKV